MLSLQELQYWVHVIVRVLVFVYLHSTYLTHNAKTLLYSNANDSIVPYLGIAPNFAND